MDQRRTRRFKLQLPLAITRSGVARITFAGRTKDISSSGVLFTTDREPDVAAPIEYVITLNHDGTQPVNLRCVGKIVRLERTAPAVGESPQAYQVAATLERYEFIRE
ncbi:MAG: PilZ domain-containing protein, partial [Bryobacteraceae bacterium]